MQTRLNLKTKTLVRRQADLMGDEWMQYVSVTGIPDGSTGYARELTLVVHSGVSGATSVARPPVREGFLPRLQFAGFTGGAGREILLMIPTGGNGGEMRVYVYRYRRGEMRLLFDSEAYEKAHPCEVIYQDGWRAAVRIETTGAAGGTYLIDLSGRGEAYLSELYAPDGRLLRPAEGFVGPVGGASPVNLSGEGPSDLLLLRQISGLYRADKLGYVQSRLRWDGEAFVPVQEDVAVLAQEEIGDA